MHVLVTGSSGHLGEALMRILPDHGFRPLGLDRTPARFTDIVADIADPGPVAEAMVGMDAVLHTATLHKPHVATHTEAQFLRTNIHGTHTILAAARTAGVGAVVFTSTTSAFGAANAALPGAPAAWINETVREIPKNIYGATKTGAESLCELFARRDRLPVVVLRTSRFFPEPDDNAATREAFADENAKANEFLFRRLDIEDAALAHIAALRRAPTIGFAKLIVSATTPFRRDQLSALGSDAPGVVWDAVPNARGVYDRLGYRMFPRIDRVYDNAAARAALGWQPAHDFASVTRQLAAGQPIGSALSRQVGAKGYHDRVYAGGLYPVS